MRTVSNSCYITSLEAQSGKAVAALAFMEHLHGRVKNVSLFRPVVSENPESDIIIHLMKERYDLQFAPEEMYGVTMADARALIAAGQYDDLYTRVLERYKALEGRSDFILCVYCHRPKLIQHEVLSIAADAFLPVEERPGTF